MSNTLIAIKVLQSIGALYFAYLGIKRTREGRPELGTYHLTFAILLIVLRLLWV